MVSSGKTGSLLALFFLLLARSIRLRRLATGGLLYLAGRGLLLRCLFLRHYYYSRGRTGCDDCYAEREGEDQCGFSYTHGLGKKVKNSVNSVS